MLVYHGSDIEVDAPNLFLGRKKLDFGRGFYTTTLAEQAEQWARRKAYEVSKPKGIVSVFEYREDSSQKVLSFDGYTCDWLRFVADNRSNNEPGNDDAIDIVRGGIANDRVISSINFFIEEVGAGRESEELVSFTLKQLSYQKPNDQICFKTERSLQSLSFIRSYEVTR